MTLHEAIMEVLRENGNKPMTCKEITEEINARRLYIRKDSLPVRSREVKERIDRHDRLFSVSKNALGRNIVTVRCEVL